MGEKMRIYIGGLGSSVQEDDLKKTFTSPQLGTVESVEIIRSKGRNFGYLDFIPVSDKGLAKLFSTYNGCMWKGGKLKLEKAKEHYLLRLKHEWEEEAELKSKLSCRNVDVDGSVHTLQQAKKDQSIEKMQLKIFFTKLRKIKYVPFKGTGRHKYSFQRVEIPPLPIHFCDCEEHCGPPESMKRNCTEDHETEICGVNEDELNMMKSILNRVLDKENRSKEVSHEADLTQEINHGLTSADNWQVDDNEDEASDEDNLVINMVGQPTEGVALFEDWGHKKTAVHQDYFVRNPESFTEPVHEMLGNENRFHFPEKKRKLSICKNNLNGAGPSKKKARKVVPDDSKDDLLTATTRLTDTESGSIQLSSDMASAHKSSWRNLVREKEGTAFHISDILTDLDHEVETKVRSDGVAAAPCFSGEDGQDGQSSKGKELEKSPDGQSSKSCASEYISARGAAWLQKSSWLQLVGDTNNNSFNLAQILPSVTFEKPELQQHDDNDFLNSRNGKQHRFDYKYQNSPTGISELLGKANKDIYATPAHPNVNDSKQDNLDLHGEQSNSDSKRAVEEDGTSAPNHGTNLVLNNRAARNIVISETCPFMRTAASMKEWMKTKAALIGSRKKKGTGKVPSRDY